MTPNQTQGIGHQKYPTYVYCSTPSPKFSSNWLYDQLFSRYCTFQDFPIDSYVKIPKSYKILIYCFMRTLDLVATPSGRFVVCQQIPFCSQKGICDELLFRDCLAFWDQEQAWWCRLTSNFFYHLWNSFLVHPYSVKHINANILITSVTDSDWIWHTASRRLVSLSWSSWSGSADIDGDNTRWRLWRHLNPADRRTGECS